MIKGTGVALAIVSATVLGSFAVPAAAQSTVEKKNLRVASWGGAYGQAQLRAIIQPAKQSLAIDIQRVELNDSRPVDQTADVLELRQVALLQGCEKGEFLRREEITLAPSKDGASPETDFLAGGLSDCGVASFAWSSLILFDRSKFKEQKPNKLSDVFDVKRFKGKRAFLRKPENLIEILALATLKGVSPQTIYSELSERENRDKVYARLEAFLPHIVWVDSPSEALAKLDTDQCVSRLLQVLDGMPLSVLNWPRSCQHPSFASLRVFGMTLSSGRNTVNG